MAGLGLANAFRVIPKKVLLLQANFDLYAEEEA